jgi:DNA-binding transcriptional ArsR family regulator
MKEGPDIARFGLLVGDPARANMLAALIEGRALTASELASLAGITPSTASSHLNQLKDGGLIVDMKQGRHRYYAIRSAEVGSMLEQLMGFAQQLGHTRLRTGPTEVALREARVCYNHLAGTKGVALYESLLNRKLIRFSNDQLELSRAGHAFFGKFGIDVQSLTTLRRPMCRACLDWSERRNHLAGSLGQALLEKMFSLRWARRKEDSRAVQFSPAGEIAFQKFIQNN